MSWAEHCYLPSRKLALKVADHQYKVLKVIWFVLVTGCRWKDVPRELGCCGETARTRLQAWEQAGIWDELHKMLLTKLRQANELHAETTIVDSTQVRVLAVATSRAPAPWTAGKKGRNTHSWSIAMAFLW